MDFTQFDSRAAASRGIWLHLDHPAQKGRKLFDDEDPAKPCRVQLMGREAPEAAAHYARIQRARAKGSAEAATEKTNEELHAELCEMAKPLIMGFQNIQRGKVAATKEDADWFLNLQLINGNPDQVSFVEQILRVVNDRGETLGNVSAT